MSHPVHLILSAGTRIVTRNDANRIGGGQLIAAGAVAVITDSPADAQHVHKVRCNDGAEAMLRRNEFSILKGFKGEGIETTGRWTKLKNVTMSFGLEKVLESKRALRRQLAARPIAKKLRILHALRERTLTLRTSTGLDSADTTALQDTPPPYRTKPTRA